MKYILRKQVIDDVPEIEITSEQYATLKAAHRALQSAFSIEQAYELLIRNYIDLEKETLHLTATCLARTILDYHELWDLHVSLNIRLVNFFTTTRLYIDQLPHHVAACTNKCEFIDQVRQRCSQEYDKHPEYRFMEALRNYAQHRDLPVHFIQSDMRWTNSDKDRQMEFSLNMAASRAVLERDKYFKREVLDECGSEVNLMFATRCYVESISGIHEFARDSIADETKSSRSRIEEARQQYRQLYEGDITGLSAIELSLGRSVEEVPLLLDWDDIRIKLQLRNEYLANLRKRYVSGKVKTRT